VLLTATVINLRFIIFSAALVPYFKRLPLKKREVLVLSRYEGLKLREIAELLGCQVGTVKAQVHRALKDLSRIYLDLQEGRTS
jgi:RNA polymerase sigma factor (sigma-70 family)